MKRFALIGAAGYVVTRHVQAIAATGNDLDGAFYPNDSEEIIDSHFPESDFLTEFDRFDCHIDRLQREGVIARFVR